MRTISKKIIIIAFVLFMILPLPYYSHVNAQIPEQIKIGLFYSGSAKDYYTVLGDGGFSLFLANDDSGVKLISDKNIKSVTVKKNVYFSTELADVFTTVETAAAKAKELRSQGLDAYCAVTGTNYTVRIGTYSTLEEAKSFAEQTGNTYAVSYSATGVLVLSGDNIWLAVDDETAGAELVPISGFLSINGTSYRGTLRFLRRAGNDIAAINILPIEEYLWSVVSKEVSPSWPVESLKAQAVAARTYAVTNMNKYLKYGFNLDNTVASQVYNGIKAEDSRTTAAVNATKGEIVTYSGTPASVFYCSSTGGKTANSEDVWENAIPYLRSVLDPYENPNESTYAKWSFTYTSSQIKEKLAQKGVNIGDITDVAAEYSSDGRAVKLTFKGTDGTKEYKKDSIRGSLGLYSTNFVLKNGSDANAHVLDSDMSKTVLPLKNLSVITKDGIKKLASLPFIMGSDKKVTAAKGDQIGEYTFTGGGWGHGVGMSQWGAKAMAENGFNYKEILKYYFTGVQVEAY